MDKKLIKTLDLTGKNGDIHMINAWDDGTPLPETDNDKARCLGVEVIFVGTDGTNDVHHINFASDIVDWQFAT